MKLGRQTINVVATVEVVWLFAILVHTVSENIFMMLTIGIVGTLFSFFAVLRDTSLPLKKTGEREEAIRKWVDKQQDTVHDEVMLCGCLYRFGYKIIDHQKWSEALVSGITPEKLLREEFSKFMEACRVKELSVGIYFFLPFVSGDKNEREDAVVIDVQGNIKSKYGIAPESLEFFCTAYQESMSNDLDHVGSETCGLQAKELHVPV